MLAFHELIQGRGLDLQRSFIHSLDIPARKRMRAGIVSIQIEFSYAITI